MPGGSPHATHVGPEIVRMASKKPQARREATLRKRRQASSIAGRRAQAWQARELD